MRKFLKIFFGSILLLVGLFSLFAVVSGKTYLFKAVYYNFADIDDYKVFSNNTVVAGQPQPWHVSAGYNKLELPASLTQTLEQSKTVAVLVIKNDSVLFEKYWDGYSESSLSGSFSMAKSITSLLIGCALKEGLINRWMNR